MYLWRISNLIDLSGRGGLSASGRWHRKGMPVVYCSDHPSTTLLEILVHVDSEDLPSRFTLLKIRCPDDLPSRTISAEEMRHWDTERTQAEGSAFLLSADACLLDVPSVVMPEARNVLINPQHPRAMDIRIETAKDYPFDSRLFQ